MRLRTVVLVTFLVALSATSVHGQNQCAVQRDGTPCDDGNACTVLDACSQGVCSGQAVVCDEPPDQCVEPIGTCQVDASGSGVCVYQPK